VKARKPRPWLRARGWRVTANVKSAGDAEWRKVSVKTACMDRPKSITLVVDLNSWGITYPCDGRGPDLRVQFQLGLPALLSDTSLKAADASAS
jgi:hypothetical protein